MAPEHKNILAEIVTLLTATMLAFAFLTYSASSQVDFDNLAKGEQNTVCGETYQGQAFTASKVKDIKTVIDKRHVDQADLPCKNLSRILWLGNSQLHYINQFKDGDHIAPYWLRAGHTNPACFEPLGFSLPNANMQEFLALSRYATNRMKLNMLVMEVEFMGFREDGLRNDFNEMLVSEVKDELRHSSPVAQDILKRYEGGSNNANEQEAKEALSGTVQKPVEQWLNDTLSSYWHIWASRPQIEGNIKLNLFLMRNYLLGIHATSTRRIIPIRYERNMAALRDILDDYRERKIPVLLYIACIRHDVPIPYLPDEYNRWKADVRKIADELGASFVNLENLVPANLWGTYVEGEIDFMHFQGPGHRLLAQTLEPHILEILQKQSQ